MTSPSGNGVSSYSDAVVTGKLLIRLGSRIHRLQVEVLERLSTPLSIRQYRILVRVDQGISSLSLQAEQARRQRSTVSKSADSLVRQGLLTRTEAVEDRRSVVLALTPAGLALLSEARSASEQLAVWLVQAAEISPETLAILADQLYEATEAIVDTPNVLKPNTAIMATSGSGQIDPLPTTRSQKKQRSARPVRR
ncbi:MAG: winged helix DNA-binding protein [Acidimicrobiaceae bacterium]|nr:winged helix DNA-binding protein [Acidimicrobiaceae bacterium]